MYRELVLELTKGNEWVKVQPPCSETVISEAEKVVGYSFPEELKNLLREMNGDKWLFLSAEEIIENVKLNREIFLPLFEEDYSKEEYQERVDRFIFFATNGCGDYYCYRVCPNGTADKSVIYIWEHEYMLRHGSSLSAVRERRIEYELSYDRPTGAGAALPPFKNTLGHFVLRS